MCSLHCRLEGREQLQLHLCSATSICKQVCLNVSYRSLGRAELMLRGKIPLYEAPKIS